MKFVHLIGAALILLQSDVSVSAGEDAKSAPAQNDITTQTRACSSCTARHQNLLRKKKQREKKALEDAARADPKSKE